MPDRAGVPVEVLQRAFCLLSGRETERINDEANRKRSAATKAQHQVSNPRAGEVSRAAYPADRNNRMPTRQAMQEAVRVVRVEFMGIAVPI